MNKKCLLLLSSIFCVVLKSDAPEKNIPVSEKKIATSAMLPVLKKLSFKEQEKKYENSADQQSGPSVWETLIKEIKSSDYKKITPEIDEERKSLNLVLSDSPQVKGTKTVPLSPEETETLVTLMEEEKEYQEQKDPLPYDNLDLPEQQQSYQQPYDQLAQNQQDKKTYNPTKKEKKKKKKKKQENNPSAQQTPVKKPFNNPLQVQQLPPNRNTGFIITQPKQSQPQQAAQQQNEAASNQPNPENEKQTPIRKTPSYSVSSLTTRTAEPTASKGRQHYTPKKKFDASFPSTRKDRLTKQEANTTESFSNTTPEAISTVPLKLEEIETIDQNIKQENRATISLQWLFKMLFYYLKMLLSFFI